MPSLRARAAVGLLRLHDTQRFYADPATMREYLPSHQDLSLTRPPDDIRRALDTEESFVDGYSCWTLRPRGGATSGMHVLHLHGGGYVEQMGKHHWNFGRWLVERLGAAVTFPMYPLVPEHDHHDIWPMVCHSYERFLAPCAPADRVITGDSAGGALALCLGQLLREQGEEQPARMALFSPWLDLAVSDPLSESIAPYDPVLGIEGLRQAGRWYAGDTPLDDPEISPVCADLAKLPPVAVFIGTRDLLLADARMLRREAECSGVDITLHEYPGMFHNWIMQPLPEAHQARAKLLEFLGAP